MTADCLFGDWSFDPFAVPLCAFRQGGTVPLRWDGARIREVHGYELMTESVPWVALAAHWAVEHRVILEVMVGPVETDMFPRAAK